MPVGRRAPLESTSTIGGVLKRWLRVNLLNPNAINTQEKASVFLRFPNNIVMVRRP